MSDDPKRILEASKAPQSVLDLMLKTQEEVIMNGGWLPPGCTDKDVDDAAPQSEPEDDAPGECEECGEPNAIWLTDSFSTGLWLCKPHLEERLTKGRGKR